MRGFDPPGVACRDLRESLVVQLDALGVAEDDLARRVLEEHWELFLRRQFPAIAKKLGIELAELEAAVELIRTLETRPGRQFSSERAQYIEPDVYVCKVGGEYVIQLNDDGLPRLRVSRAYRRMLQTMRHDGSQSEAKQFIKDKIRSAVWLIKSLDQRQRTIYKVANSIVRQQREFLDHGIEQLRPMVLRDVAEDIGMHESTVSRVVSNKYIHTPRGLFPMKFFFHSGIDREYGDNISSLTVKRKIEQLDRGGGPEAPAVGQRADADPQPRGDPDRPPHGGQVPRRAGNSLLHRPQADLLTRSAMNIEYVGRNYELDDRVRGFTDGKLAKLEKFLQEPIEIRVTLEVEKHRQIAEVHVTHRDGLLQAPSETLDMFDAIDPGGRKGRKAGATVAPESGRQAPPPRPRQRPQLAAGRGRAREPRLRRRAAGDQVRTAPHQADDDRGGGPPARKLEERFVVFRDATSDRVSVLYKRRDNNYGLIAPEF